MEQSKVVHIGDKTLILDKDILNLLEQYNHGELSANSLAIVMIREDLSRESLINHLEYYISISIYNFERAYNILFYYDTLLSYKNDKNVDVEISCNSSGCKSKIINLDEELWENL